MHIDTLKKYFWVLLDLALVALVILMVAAMPAVSKYGKDMYPTRVISASAEGKATVTPDIAEVSFSVLSKGVNPQALSQTNTEKMNAVLASIKSQGIEDKDIKTTGYNLNPDYRWDEQTERNFITGYTLTQTVNVKVRDLSKVASLVGGLTPLGVNQIGGINFRVENSDAALKTAREEAIQKARVKAEEMARAAGTRLGRLVTMNEYASPIAPYYSRDFGMGGMAEVKNIAPNIQPGSEELSVGVSVTYELD